MKTTEYFYALYHGDTPLIISDYWLEIQQYLGWPMKSVKWLSYPAAHKRFANQNAYLVYKYPK